MRPHRAFAFVLLGLIACKKPPPPTASDVDAGAPGAAPIARETPPPPSPATQPFARVVAMREGSTVVLGGAHAYVADEDSASIVAVDVATMKVAGATPLGGRPAQMIATADGRLAVALRDEHALAFFAPRADDAAKLVEKSRIATSDEPIGLALAPDGKTIAVTAGWGHALDVVVADKKVKSVDLEREPRGVTITDDGAQAIVSHAIANVASIVKLDDGSVKKTVIGRAQMDLGHKPKLPDSTTSQFDWGFFGVRFERHSRHAYASLRLPGEKERYVLPHALVATGAPPGREGTMSNGYGTGSGAGGGFTAVPDELLQIFPNVSFTVDVLDMKKIDAPVDGLIEELMEGQRACFLPRAAAATADRIFVACAGTSEVLEYKSKQLRIVGAPVRWSVPDGPMGLALDASNESLFVWSQHARSFSKLDLTKKRRDDETIKNAPSVAFDEIEPRAPWADARIVRGRKLFFACNDERLTADHRACASCHPDGRDDGLTWSTPEGPRQTMFLAGRLDRKTPFGWHGTHASFEEHVKNTVKNLRGTGLPDEDIEALGAYARAMSSPSRGKPGVPNASAAHGKEIFFSQETRCSTCHAESQAFANKEPQDVQSGTPFDTTKKFQVPSLAYVGGSAPYFHDGRYKTLEDLIKKSDSKMGHTAHLSEDDVNDLASYLRTL